MKKIYLIYGAIAIIFIIYLIFTKSNNHLKINNELGKNIYEIYGYDEIYNVKNSKKIERIIENKFSRFNTLKNPLVIYNAYGTNKLSLNVYFYTKENSKIQYNISAENVNDFKIEVYEKEEYTKKHEFQIIGLISGKKNIINISSEAKDGKIENYEFEVNTPEFEVPKIEKISETNDKKSSSGLYVLLGTLKKDDTTTDDIFLSDDYGNIRGIVPISNTILDNKFASNDTADDFIVYKDGLYYNISTTTITKINNQGKVEDLYSIEGYSKHHDFKIYDDKIFILGNKNNSKTGEDMIVIYDMKSKRIEKVLDLKEIVSEIYNKYIKEKNIEDWIHINSIDVKNDEILISSRELSSVFKITNIYEKAEIEYIIGPKEIYEKTRLKDKVLNKKNNFEIQLGQHTAFFVGDNEIGLYNNGYGNSSSVYWIDWRKYGKDRIDRIEKSYYYLYEVEEKKKEVSLKQIIEVKPSPFMSSSSINDDNIIILSRKSKYLGEFSKDGQKIQEYSLDRYCYRIKKYTFKGFWFK